MGTRLLAIGILIIQAANASAAPPVTDPAVPAPGAAAATQWIAAGFQSRLLEFYGKSFPRSEAARMLTTVLRGEQLRAGFGWYDPSQFRFGWKWLASRFDANGDGRIVKSEFPVEAEYFSRLDRDRNGAITSDDFDWTENSPWAKTSATSLRFFRAIDRNGNGRLTEEEMQNLFKKLSGEKGYVKPDDLRDALIDAMMVESGKGSNKPKRVSEEVWLKALFEGDLGSPLTGPRVGEEAPDFTLFSPDGKNEVTLSKFRGRQPVVLVFGNFTCGPFRAQFGAIEDLYKRYRDRAAFVAVYVREAHAVDGAFSANNENSGIVIKQPRTLSERTDVAKLCTSKLEITTPLVVDTIDDRVGHAYSGSPIRLYLVDQDGKIAYQGGRGPFGFKPGELEQSLISLLIERNAPTAPSPMRHDK